MMSFSGDDDWAGTLGGTGTEGRPLTAPDTPPPSPPGSPNAVRPPGNDLLERWSLARYGVRSLGDDDVLSRQSHLESLADGSYVEELRGDPTDAPGRSRPTAQGWSPYPPPSGQPVELEPSRSSWLRRRRP